MDILEDMFISVGIKNSLMVKLELSLENLNLAQYYFVNGLINLANGHLSMSESTLNDFLNEVRAQNGKGINENDAYLLINQAQEIINLIIEAYI